MSAALAVIGVTVFACLTLCKKRVKKHGRVGGTKRDEPKGDREFTAFPVWLWHCSTYKSMSRRNHCFK